MFKMLNGIPFVFLSEPDTDYNDKLRALALSVEGKISKLPATDGWENLTETSPTTSRYGAYNTFLLDPVTWPLLNLIRAGYWLMIHSLNIPRTPRVIESWINVHRGGEHLHRHSHHYPFIAYYSVNAEGSSTIYGSQTPGNDDVEIKNKNGQLVVTVGYPIHHEVTPWEKEDPRITIACDIAGIEMNHSNRMFIPFDA